MLNNILLSYLLFVLIIRCFSGVPVYSVLREIEPFDRAKMPVLRSVFAVIRNAIIPTKVTSPYRKRLSSLINNPCQSLFLSFTRFTTTASYKLLPLLAGPRAMMQPRIASIMTSTTEIAHCWTSVPLNSAIHIPSS